MKPRILVLVLAACAFAAPVVAEHSSRPYAGQQTRPIKALSSEDIAGLLKGEGMGMAKAAELNGYPGPVHVLALARELELTPDQGERVQVIYDRMGAAAKPLGAELVEHERTLDQLFAKGGITPDRLAVETAAIGALEGRLRQVHLVAHLETRALLNADQIALYQKLRGYGNSVGPMHHHHG